MINDSENLRSLKAAGRWEESYEQPPLSLSESIYGPALTHSIIYRRSTGYFNSAMLREISLYLDNFCERGGKMRLITSPDISNQDMTAIKLGEEYRDAEFLKIATNGFDKAISAANEFSKEDKERYSLLTHMIATGFLEIKFAAGIVNGIFTLFHEKSGYFEDELGDYISFTGSANETQAGVIGQNAEVLTVFPSWTVDRYAKRHKDRFEELWKGDKQHIYVRDFPIAYKDRLFDIFPPREPDSSRYRRIFAPTPPTKVAIEQPGQQPLPDFDPLPNQNGINLKPYQETAIQAWFDADSKGILKMATGTGKTFTALAAATKKALELAEKKRPLLVIVTAPAIDLVNQWGEEAKKFNWTVSLCHGELLVDDRHRLEASFNKFRAPFGEFAEMIITTNNSITPSAVNGDDPYILRKISQHRGELMFIGDEMHSLGTENTLNVLPENASYRIGLSATPERYRDPEGTQRLFEYFGDPVIEIDIHDAIHKYKALCPYSYHPIFVELTPHEAREFKRLSQKIATSMAAGGDGHPYVGQRQRVMQHADEKLSELSVLLEGELKDESYMFIYAPEGFDPDDIDTDYEGIRATEKIEEIMEAKGFKVEQYNGETSGQMRKVLQTKLAEKELDALISMKCLNQGVDVPQARVGVFLASTKNSQQFVQRRGRILRKYPGKENAVLFDMIVRPPISDDMSKSEKRLLRSELARAAELAFSASNKDIGLLDLQRYAIEYNLDQDFEEEGAIPWLDGEKPDPEVLLAQNEESDELSGN